MHLFLLISLATRRDTNRTNTTNVTDMTKIGMEDWALISRESEGGSEVSMSEVSMSGRAVKGSNIDKHNNSNDKSNVYNDNDNNNCIVNDNDNRAVFK